MALGLISECLDIFLPASKVVDAAGILFKEINFDVYPAFVSWYNDILVDLDSQLGLDSGSLIDGTGSFKGFNRIIRPFIGGSADDLYYIGTFCGHLSILRTVLSKMTIKHLDVSSNLQTFLFVDSSKMQTFY